MICIYAVWLSFDLDFLKQILYLLFLKPVLSILDKTAILLLKKDTYSAEENKSTLNAEFYLKNKTKLKAWEGYKYFSGNEIIYSLKTAPLMQLHQALRQLYFPIFISCLRNIFFPVD